MTSDDQDEPKPKRLYFKTYLQLIKNSVGTEMFRSFYIELPDGTEKDALSNGSDSCAFYVSAVLTIFGVHSGVHGTVEGVVKDLQDSDKWQAVTPQSAQAGDVLVWEAVEIEGESFEHIGFCIGNGRAISTSWTAGSVHEHSVDFDGKRAVKSAFRCTWE